MPIDVFPDAFKETVTAVVTKGTGDLRGTAEVSLSGTCVVVMVENGSALVEERLKDLREVGEVPLCSSRVVETVEFCSAVVIEKLSNVSVTADVGEAELTALIAPDTV